MGNYYDTNNNARIVTGVNAFGDTFTETRYRDDNFSASANTDENNSTELVIKNGSRTLRLTGGNARTLFRLLTKHYGSTGKSFNPVKVELTG